MQNAPEGSHEDSHESAHRKFDSAHENVHESVLGQFSHVLFSHVSCKLCHRRGQKTKMRYDVFKNFGGVSMVQDNAHYL